MDMKSYAYFLYYTDKYGGHIDNTTYECHLSVAYYCQAFV